VIELFAMRPLPAGGCGRGPKAPLASPPRARARACVRVCLYFFLNIHDVVK